MAFLVRHCCCSCGRRPRYSLRRTSDGVETGLYCRRCIRPAFEALVLVEREELNLGARPTARELRRLKRERGGAIS
jgi:hypothetical protein